jgi:hypothetical protein
MATNVKNQLRMKTTLAVLRSRLTLGEEEKQVRLSRADGRSREDNGETVKWAADSSHAYGPKKFPARLKAEAVAAWLGCSEANVRDIESRKVSRKLKNGERLIRQLTEEQVAVVAYQTGVSIRWLLDNDPSKPILNSFARPYTQKDFDQRQAEIKSGKDNFSNPLTLRDKVAQVNRLAEWFGMVTAVLLRALERGQADIYDYKLKRALRKIYGDTWPGESPHEWNDLTMTAIYHGKITLNRPDVGPLLDAWETRFKEIASRKSGGKAPLHWPRRARSLPAVRWHASKPTGTVKAAKQPASKPAAKRAGRKSARR